MQAKWIKLDLLIHFNFLLVLGRGDNAWLSPPGSLSLSMYIRLDMNSALGQAPALIQTVPAVAAARAISQHLPHIVSNVSKSHKLAVMSLKATCSCF